jgi:hypothetical protein
MVMLNHACGLQVKVTYMWLLQWLRDNRATWDSCVISCAEEHGYNYVVEWTRENCCPEP